MGLFNKKSTEEIQDENRILRERAIGRDIERSDKAKAKALRRQTQRENLALRNPKKIRVVKKVGKGAKDLGKGILWGLNKAGNQYAKAQASKQPVRKVRKKKRKGKQNLVYVMVKSKPKAKSKKRKVRRVRKVKRSSLGDKFGIEGRFSL